MYAIVLALGLLGCSGDDAEPESPTPGVSEAEMEQILSDLNTISQSVEPSLSGSNPVEQLAALLGEIRGLPSVASAHLEGTLLVVRFTRGLVATWEASYEPDVAASSSDGGHADIRLIAPVNDSEDENVVGNRNAVLINTQAHYPQRQSASVIMSEIKALLEANGFRATIVNSPDCDLSWFNYGLEDCGLIVYNGHVGNFDGHSWFATGQEIRLHWLERWILAGAGSWADNEYVAWGYWRNRCDRDGLSFYDIKLSERFIQSVYGTNRLRRPLVLLAGCNVFAEGELLPRAFVEGGAAAVVGWDDNVLYGPSLVHIKDLVSSMLGGMDLGEAISALPSSGTLSSYRDCERTERFEAHMKVFPPSGTSLRLVSEYSIELEINGISWKSSKCMSASGARVGGQWFGVALSGSDDLDEYCDGDGESRPQFGASVLFDSEFDGALPYTQDGLLITFFHAGEPITCNAMLGAPYGDSSITITQLSDAIAMGVFSATGKDLWDPSLTYTCTGRFRLPVAEVQSRAH
ncbi:MAG: hypothetical protein IPK64_18415 [bacterium]|nr:hypothetical protein [bacterium]